MPPPAGETLGNELSFAFEIYEAKLGCIGTKDVPIRSF